MKKLILITILLLTFTNLTVNAEENKTTCDEISISNLFRYHSDKQEKLEEMLKNKKICDKNTDEVMKFIVYVFHFS